MNTNQERREQGFLTTDYPEAQRPKHRIWKTIGPATGKQLHSVRFEIWLRPMPSITLKEIPEDLRAQLKQAANANFRSLSQEAVARIEMSFQIEEAFSTRRVQAWIDQALASGPEEPLSRERFDAAFQRAVKKVASKKAA